MEANVTISNSTFDKKMESYIVLPNKNSYSLTAGLKYNDNYDWLQHVISYSKSEEPMCFTVSDVSNLVVVPFIYS